MISESLLSEPARSLAIVFNIFIFSTPLMIAYLAYEKIKSRSDPRLRKENITFITGNKNKYAEVKKILGDDMLDSLSLDLTEIQGKSEDIASHKANEAWKVINGPVLVEDSSFIINDLSPMPGPYIKYCLGKSGNDCSMIINMSAFSEQKRAMAICIFAFYEEYMSEPMLFKAVIHGTIVPPRGENGFGYDPVFMPSGYNKTYGQMTADEKNECSPRRIALEKVKKYLEERKSMKTPPSQKRPIN